MYYGVILKVNYLSFQKWIYNNMILHFDLIQFYVDFGMKFTHKKKLLGLKTGWSLSVSFRRDIFKKARASQFSLIAFHCKVEYFNYIWILGSTVYVDISNIQITHTLDQADINLWLIVHCLDCNPAAKTTCSIPRGNVMNYIYSTQICNCITIQIDKLHYFIFPLRLLFAN